MLAGAGRGTEGAQPTLVADERDRVTTLEQVLTFGKAPAPRQPFDRALVEHTPQPRFGLGIRLTGDRHHGDSLTCCELMSQLISSLGWRGD
jgi:hypothetical protein